MLTISRFVLILILWGLSGCAPAVNVTRHNPRPKRSKNCDLNLIKSNGLDEMRKQRLMIIATASISAFGVHEPWDKRHVDAVKVKACEIGGTAISLSSFDARDIDWGVDETNMVFTIYAPWRKGENPLPHIPHLHIPNNLVEHFYKTEQ